MQATILELQIENDTLKRELGECKKREDELRDQVSQAKLVASLVYADRRTNELDQYIRRNNCRVCGIPERNGEKGEEQEVCEEEVLVFFLQNKIKLDIRENDIEAYVTAWVKRTPKRTRGINVRFI